MIVQLGKTVEVPGTTVNEFTGQECPLVQNAGEGGVMVTYYESMVLDRTNLSGRFPPQKRVTLILSREERARLKGLL